MKKKPFMKGGLTLSQMGVNTSFKKTPFDTFSRYMDTSGNLNFGGKAILNAEGVNFNSGISYKIRMSEFELYEELGRGQYGVVKKVYHKPTNVTMAMKEIRLEMDQNRFNQIVMELDILHKSHSPYIVDFYGAFFIESCVYYCMEYMDAGSLERLYYDGMPENVIAKISHAVVDGLRFLKDELSIIHRDVKPTNILLNRNGQVKLCDFGVSGQLIQSLAKTHIGCQNYMAPERISESGTYTAQSDVWSFGLTILEVALGSYPYPLTIYDSMFAKLNAIVSGEPPRLPEGKYSEEMRDFIAQCLQKNPKLRPTYSQLLNHPFISSIADLEVDMKSWVAEAMNKKD